MREIQLTGKKYPGLVALVDDEDYDRVIVHGWWAVKFPHSKTFYAARRSAGARFTAPLRQAELQE